MKKYIFWGLSAFLSAALWLLPLSVVQPYLEKEAKGLTLGSTNGTVWNGTASELIIDKQSLGEVSWKVNPIQSLFSLKLKAHFKITGNDINADGLAGLGINKTLYLDDTTFEINPDYLNKIQKNVKLAGDITGKITHAVILDKNIPQIKGVIDWKNGTLNSPLLNLKSGDYKAIVSPSSDDLDIKLSSNKAPIKLDGSIKLLNKDWAYSTNINAKSNEPGLTAALNFAGKKQPNGSVLIKETGDLSRYIKR